MRAIASFWAQALDDVGADHFFHLGECVAEDSVSVRQSIVSRVAETLKKGRRYYCKDNVLLAADRSSFVTEVPMIERDPRGRVSPIVCYGSFDSIKEDGFADCLCEEIETFAVSIGQSVAPETLDLVREAFNILKKKQLRRKAAQLSAILLVTIVLLAIGYWVVMKKL